MAAQSLSAVESSEPEPEDKPSSTDELKLKTEQVSSAVNSWLAHLKGDEKK